MSSMPVSQAALCDKLRQAILEAARGMTANAKSEPTARLFAQVGSTDGLEG